MLSIRIAALPLLLCALASAIPVPAAGPAADPTSLINPVIIKYEEDVMKGKREVNDARAVTLNTVIIKYEEDVMKEKREVNEERATTLNPVIIKYQQDKIEKE